MDRTYIHGSNNSIAMHRHTSNSGSIMEGNNITKKINRREAKSLHADTRAPRRSRHEEAKEAKDRQTQGLVLHSINPISSYLCKVFLLRCLPCHRPVGLRPRGYILELRPT